MGDNMYCGVGPVPKGRVRGTPEYCVQTNQVRYYGLEAIDRDLLKTAKGKSTDLIKEQLKLKKIEDDAKLLIKEVKNLKVVLDNEKSRPSDKKKAQKRFDTLMAKRDKLVKRLKTQKELVERLEKEEKSKKKKSSTKKSKKSGSKTAKKKKSGTKRMT